MIHPHKKQKVGDNITYKEEVLFNTDTLSKIISYLPSIDLLSLAQTCKRYGISNDINEEQSLIEESARIAIQDIATEEQLAALPHYDGDSSLADYHYLQLLRAPLLFDQVIGKAEYVNNDKSSVRHIEWGAWETAFSNSILRRGKHYATFRVFTRAGYNANFTLGVMRPGQANHHAHQSYPLARNPMFKAFFQYFLQRNGRGSNSSINSCVDCCLYNGSDGECCLNTWGSHNVQETYHHESQKTWEGMESMSPGEDTFGLLLDLDEGTLSVFRNGRKLGVMMRGLAGQYCWVVSLWKGSSVTIKRGTIPPS